MNTIQKILLAFCLLSAPFIGSCGEDDDQQECVIGEACNDSNMCTINDALDSNCVCTGTSKIFTVELQAEVNAFIAAATAYSQNPSQANCILYKNSLLAYLEAASDFEVCVPANQQAEFQASIDAALANANALTC